MFFSKKDIEDLEDFPLRQVLLLMRVFQILISLLHLATFMRNISFGFLPLALMTTVFGLCQIEYLYCQLNLGGDYIEVRNVLINLWQIILVVLAKFAIIILLTR